MERVGRRTTAVQSLRSQAEDRLATAGDVKYCVAFRRIKNFTCVEIRPQSKNLLVCVKVDPSQFLSSKASPAMCAQSGILVQAILRFACTARQIWNVPNRSSRRALKPANRQLPRGPVG